MGMGPVLLFVNMRAGEPRTPGAGVARLSVSLSSLSLLGVSVYSTVSGLSESKRARARERQRQRQRDRERQRQKIWSAKFLKQTKFST